MRTIDGLVVVAEMSSSERSFHLLFGKNCGNGTGTHQNFQTNDLVPYDSLREARKAAKEIQKLHDITISGIQRVVMQLAESHEEWAKLKSRSPLVAVESRADHDGRNPWQEVVLYGRRVEGCKGFDSRSELCDNNFRPYITFKCKEEIMYEKKSKTKTHHRTVLAYDQATHAAYEITRQTGSRTTMASFALKNNVP